MAVSNSDSFAHSEGTTQVFHSLLAIQFCLRRGVANPLQRLQSGNTRTFRELAAQFLRLVVFPLPFPHRVQWHRDKCSEGPGCDPWVTQCFQKPLGKLTAKMPCLVVFEFVDALANHSPAEIRGDGVFKMHVAAFAVWAFKCLGNRALERIRAALTTRWLQLARGTQAIFTDMDTPLGGRVAFRAMRRVTQVYDCVERF